MSETARRGRLKIYFGYASGVGKTHAMLDDAQEQFRRGVSVLVGYVEAGDSAEAKRLMQGLPALPRKWYPGGDARGEFDLDEALKRKPTLLLLDELAHANASGARNRKRFQDVDELLGAGIDVYTTVDVQHIESLNDVVERITKMPVAETVPDSIFDRADLVRMIDLEPEELLGRFEGGAARGRPAVSREDLKLLREIALRRAADRLSHENRRETRLSGEMPNARLLACVGPSPWSARVIRWTARTAEAYQAPWVAVYVQGAGGDRASAEQNAALRANLDLADRLGAEVVTLYGRDVVDAVTEYARLSGITNIVLGKSRRRSPAFRPWTEAIEDRLIERLPGVEVSIIPGEPDRAYAPKIRAPLRSFHINSGDALKTVALLAGATLLAFGLDALGLSDQNVVMTYILAVMLVARYTEGRVYSVAASLLGVLAFDFFFVEPEFQMSAFGEYQITFAIMLSISLAVCALTARIKDEVKLAVEREQRTTALYEITKNLLVTRGLDNIVALTSQSISMLLGRPSVFYVADPETGGSVHADDPSEASLLSAHEERACARWVFSHGKPAGSGTDTLSNAKAYYQPVLSQGKVLGVLGAYNGHRHLDHGQLMLLKMIASQVALALERQFLSDEQRRILVESEKEKMRGNLLRAISHDLRTPLTGILGASSTILEADESLEAGTRERLLRNIKEDAQWLIRMVENLLTVTRILGDSADVQKSPEAVEEIVAEAVRRVRKRYPDRVIAVKVPPDLLMVPMEGTLIVQVLINLIENAIRYSPPGASVEVEATKEGDVAGFEVRDHGPGIEPSELPYLFDGYAAGRKPLSGAARGMGIGLSICNSIVKAHHGVLEAYNQAAGGAVFRFKLPLEGA